MPKVMKPPTGYNADDVLTDGNWYDGPPPKPGLYKGVVKKIYAHKKNDEIRWMVLCEITEGKYKGAGVSKWLQLTPQGSPWFNQFLHALTDGSEEQKTGIRKSFKQHGYAVDDPDDKKRLPVVRIGKNFNPIGVEVSFVTKMRTGTDDGIERAEISRFVVKSGNGASDDDSDDGLDEALDEASSDDSDGLDEFASDTTENPDPTGDSSEGEDGEDDPWDL